jgi:integrase
MSARKATPITISNDQQEIKIYTTESHGRPLHQLSYYRGGKRERRSFADLNEAKREARIILGELARDSIQAENLTAAEIESYTIARRVLTPLGVPVHVAAEAFVSARAQLAPNVSLHEAICYFNQFNRGVDRRPISELAELYLAGLRASGVTEAYLRVVRRYLKRLGEFAAGRMLPDLRAPDLDQFLQAGPWAPVTRNGIREHVLAFCSWAIGRGYLGRDWREFDEVTVYYEPPTIVTIFTPEEMERLLITSGGRLTTPFLAIGAFAGLRTSEIERLDWKSVNFERGYIEVRAETCKTRARRLVPISENLKAWLRPFAMSSGPVILHRAIAHAALVIAENAGVKWKKNALRHSFVSYRLALTNDGAKTALEAGHNQSILFRHYREIVEPHAAEKWFGIMPPLEMQRGLLGICRSKYARNTSPGARLQQPACTDNIVPLQSVA